MLLLTATTQKLRTGFCSKTYCGDKRIITIKNKNQL